MKQYLLTIIMLLTLATTTQVAAQKHRHSNVATAAVTVPSADSTGIEAFSDTTGVVADDSTYSYNSYGRSGSYSVNVTTPVDHILNSVSWNDVAGGFMVVCVVAIVFLLSPLLIIALIFYFINKNRKEKLRLAQMAVQNGQPIPEQLIKRQMDSYDINLRSGIKQLFLGLGLMVLLYIIIGKLGLGIGALVFFIGVGKVVIAIIDKNSKA